jgi:hypothetical protein
MTISPGTGQAHRAAMQRLFIGKPQHTDGRLTKNNLWREAGVSRATMNRATEILAEWGARAADSPTGTLQHQHNHQITELRGKLRHTRAECRRLQDHVDAAATVITTLLAENVALREQIAKPSAAVVPLSRTHAVRE